MVAGLKERKDKLTFTAYLLSLQRSSGQELAELGPVDVCMFSTIHSEQGIQGISLISLWSSLCFWLQEPFRSLFTAFTMIMHSCKGNVTLCLNLIIKVLFVGIVHMVYIPYFVYIYFRKSEKIMLLSAASVIIIKTNK